MTITINCSACSQRFSGSSGKKVRCPKCHTINSIPLPDEPEETVFEWVDEQPEQVPPRVAADVPMMPVLNEWANETVAFTAPAVKASLSGLEAIGNATLDGLGVIGKTLQRVGTVGNPKILVASDTSELDDKFGSVWILAASRWGDWCRHLRWH